MARVSLTLLLTLVAGPALAAKPKPAPVAPVAAPAPPVPSVKNGVELWRAGDYAGAVAMWQPYANGNDPDAMFNIGQAYKLGRAVPKDLGIARDWYRRAALQGHLPAQANLGILLFQAGEKAEAVRWLKAAADKNEMRAQYVLGVANWNGDGVPRSMTLAYGYLARASAQGLEEAKTALANLTGVIAPVERANGWAVATSLAGGNGVPPEFAPGASKSVLAARSQVIKPLPARPAPVFAKAPEPAPTGMAAVSPDALPPSAQLVKPVSAAAAPTVAPVSIASTVPARPVMVASALTAPPPVTAPQPAQPTGAASVPVPITAPVPQPQRDAAVAATRPSAPPVASVAVPSSTAPPVTSRAVETVAGPVSAPPRRVEVAAVAPRPVAKAPPKPTGWRVQLGAFAKRAQAEVAWTDMKTKQKQVVGTQQPIYLADGAVTKLQMGPYKDKTAARDACARIAFSGRACFVTEG